MDIAEKTKWEILNSTADDWESLETIYRSLNQVEAPDGSLTIGSVGHPGPLLEVVADGICQLTETGLFEARMLDAPGQPAPDLEDRSYVWRAWFRMTPAGRSVWSESGHAPVG